MKKFAFVFPGQGSQSQGMISDFYSKYDCVKQLFKTANEVLNYNIWDILEHNPEDKLNQTQYTQPAMLVADIAVWQVWQTQNEFEPPLIVAGHSLGEYAALVVAGVMSFEDALQVVAKRAQFMQSAIPENSGAMAAIIGLDDEQLSLLCDKASEGEIVAPANYNCPGQVVLAGTAQAIQRAIDLALTMNARMAKKIAVSVPAHCKLMDSAGQKLSEILDQVRLHSPNIPFINNVDVLQLKNIDDIKKSLIQQVSHPVRWVEIIEQIARNDTISAIVECGPGKVLSKLIKRITNTLPAFSLNDDASLAKLKNEVTPV